MIKPLLQSNLFIGIEHTAQKEAVSFNLLVLKKRKKELGLELLNSYTSFDELTDALDKQAPIFLVVNNEYVLSKKIEGILEQDEAVAEAFPNLKIDDFYYEVLQTRNSTLVSICRKDVIEKLLKDYKDKQINIVGFSLGNLIASQVADFIDITNLETSNSTITFFNKHVVDIAPSSNDKVISYSINGLSVTSKTILPLAGILAYYTKKQTTVSNFSDRVNRLKEDFNQKRIFDIGFKASLITAFVLLLISFLLFSHFSQKITTLKEELELNKTYKNILIKRSDAVKKKESLINDYSMASSRVSWFLDKIGSTVPNSILLSDIQFQPLEKSIKEDKEVTVNHNTILIKGKSINSADFTNWIQALEKQDWVTQVQIQEYGSHKQTIPEFEIIITIK